MDPSKGKLTTTDAVRLSPKRSEGERFRDVGGLGHQLCRCARAPLKPTMSETRVLIRVSAGGMRGRCLEG